MLPLFTPPVRVVFFITSDCPICRRYSPEVNRIVRDFPKANFRMVYSEPGITTKTAKQHQKEFKIMAPFLIDPKAVEAKRAGATVVPTAVVYMGQSLVYRGRIDDAYGSDYKWRKPTSPDLRNAIQSALAGQAPKIKETKPIGCTISL
ncbi:MAG: hypothetical protein CBB60_006960 [Armatimonadetes bacterium Cent15-Ar3]|nr:MAG: hypothetical protein CBB60_006960 [Armatimonadetes bacterium Cent15-Ar3]